MFSLHIHIRIFDRKIEKSEVHGLLKSELAHDRSLQEIAALDSFSVRCSASYESDIFSNPFQDRDFSRFGWNSLKLSKNITFRSRPPQHENSEISRDEDHIGDTLGDVAASIASIWE